MFDIVVGAPRVNEGLLPLKSVQGQSRLLFNVKVRSAEMVKADLIQNWLITHFQPEIDPCDAAFR